MSRASLLALLLIPSLAGLAAIPVASAAPRAKKAVLPDWTIVSRNDLGVNPGFASLEGDYRFTMDGLDASIHLSYDEHGALVGGGGIGLSFFSLLGEYSVDEQGVQHVALYDFPEFPGLRIDGVVSEDARQITGTYTHAGPYLDFTEPGAGDIVVQRYSPAFIPATFRCVFSMTMNRKGLVTAQSDEEGREERASFSLYRGVQVSGGLVRGKVVTDPVTLLTTATVRIRGTQDRKSWSVLLEGPVDEAGFHALADFRIGPWVLDDIPIELPSGPGPEPPPPPPPPPPKNQLPGGTATLGGGLVTIERANAPAKFRWGRGADVTCQVPLTILDETDDSLVADPTTASGTNPVRFYVKIGNVVYGTAVAGGSVTLTIPRDPGGNRLFSTTRGQQVQILCKGTIAAVSGKTRKVDALLVATVE